MSGNNNDGAKILKRTRGVCPECLLELEAFVVRMENKVVLRRRCLIHGEIYTTISNKANEFEELFYYYHELNSIDERKRIKKMYTIFYTNKCNIDCPICFMNANFKDNFSDPPNESLKYFLKNLKIGKINIFGGEPTIREDLPGLIKLIKKSRNLSAIFTNGIKISELEYLKTLKQAGLDEIHLQFDGFSKETELKFRNTDLLEKKLKALDNARIIDLPVVFEVTIDRTVNLQQISNIFDYALRNWHVRGICFRSYCALGKRAIGIDRLTIDELVTVVKENSQGIIKERDLFILQKLVYIMAEWCKFDWCFSHRYMLIYRKKDGKGFLGLGEILNFQRVEPYLNRYLSIRKKNGFFSGAYFFLIIIPNMLSLKGFGVFVHLLKVIIASKFYRKLTQSSFGEQFLVIDFESPCDRFTFDLNKVCNTKVISEDLKIHPSFYMASLEKERLYQEYAQNTRFLGGSPLPRR